MEDWKANYLKDLDYFFFFYILDMIWFDLCFQMPQSQSEWIVVCCSAKIYSLCNIKFKLLFRYSSSYCFRYRKYKLIIKFKKKVSRNIFWVNFSSVLERDLCFMWSFRICSSALLLQGEVWCQVLQCECCPQKLLWKRWRNPRLLKGWHHGFPTAESN